MTNRTTIDLPIPHDPAEREAVRAKSAALENTQVEWLPNAVELTDELLASIAISLKRIADAMGD